MERLFSFSELFFGRNLEHSENFHSILYTEHPRMAKVERNARSRQTWRCTIPPRTQCNQPQRHGQSSWRVCRGRKPASTSCGRRRERQSVYRDSEKAWRRRVNLRSSRNPDHESKCGVSASSNWLDGLLEDSHDSVGSASLCWIGKGRGYGWTATWPID